MKRTLLTLFTLGLILVFGSLAAAQTVDSLPSWNDGKAKQSIIAFVEQVTTPGSPSFVAREDRVAPSTWMARCYWKNRPIRFLHLPSR